MWGKPSLIYYNDSYKGLKHQGSEGADAKHQDISSHTQINCNLKYCYGYKKHVAGLDNQTANTACPGGSRVMYVKQGACTDH